MCSYPLPLPSNISIPAWAYQKISEIFLPSVAQEVASQSLPDSTPISSTPASVASNVPMVSSHQLTPTSTSVDGSAPTVTSTTAAMRNPSSKNITIGVVVGVVGGIICISLVLFFYMRYRKGRRGIKRYFDGVYEKPEDDLQAGSPYLHGTGNSALLAENFTPLRLYDPADPSTYPPAPTRPPVLPTMRSPSSPISPSTQTTSTRSYGRHTRQGSSESDSLYSRALTHHSRQTSTDTTSTRSVLSSVSSERSRKFSSGYHPSGVAYRAIRDNN